MARASCIYLLWKDGKLAAAFTVKYESQEWAARQPGGLNAYRRTRIADGVYSDKDEKPCPWEPGK